MTVELTCEVEREIGLSFVYRNGFPYIFVSTTPVALYALAYSYFQPSLGCTVTRLSDKAHLLGS